MTSAGHKFAVLLLSSIRMEFLEHLEEWKIQAMDRANSVVAAKVSGINGC